MTEQGKRLKYIRDASPSSFHGPERFTSPRIFGSVGFASGRHCWEVEVGLKIDWEVGVARETVSRRQMTSLTKEEWCFAIGKRGANYSIRSNPSVTLHLSPGPTHVGVYLDYDNGTLSFYDIQTRAHFLFHRTDFLRENLPVLLSVHLGQEIQISGDYVISQELLKCELVLKSNIYCSSLDTLHNCPKLSDV